MCYSWKCLTSELCGLPSHIRKCEPKRRQRSLTTGQWSSMKPFSVPMRSRCSWWHSSNPLDSPPNTRRSCTAGCLRSGMLASPSHSRRQGERGRGCPRMRESLGGDRVEEMCRIPKPSRSSEFLQLVSRGLFKGGSSPISRSFNPVLRKKKFFGKASILA